MNYIKNLVEGTSISEIYLCKSKQLMVSKNGKEYISLSLQDKTGIIDAKIWEPDSVTIEEFNIMNFVNVSGNVTSFNGNLQLNINSISVADEDAYDDSEYSPTTEKDIDEMYDKLLSYINDIKNEYLLKLLKSFFVDNEKFIKRFKMSSAAKTVHHATIGGLLEHTLSVTQICDYLSNHYQSLNKDLLITAAICHDIGKVKEFSVFPENDYTDEGNLLGHIYIGTELINEHAKRIEGFPRILLNELKHCILAHHGELEYGSPKKPALIEAVALHFADNTDSTIKRFEELLSVEGTEKWSDKNDFFLGTKYRKTL